MGYIGNKPAQGLFDTQNIKDGGVQTADIADSAVTESKVADGSIQTSKIANGAVTAAKIADGAAVPSQTGQAGKYLTTDGTTASWDTVDLTPYATTTALANAVANASNWDTAYSWGDHSVQGYATTSALTAAVANSSNWDTAFGWGNHASVGYLVAADIVGKMNTSGGTFTGNVGFGDNVKAQFGASNDLQIYHDGYNSFIVDTGTGGLGLRGSTFVALQGTNGENGVLVTENGSAQLRFNNSPKLETTATGVSVTGAVSATSFSGDGSALTGIQTSPYDQDTASTGYFALPSGTTAQRPGSAAAGYTRYNTTTGSVEFYDGSNWISTNLIPTINSITGAIYAGAASTLTLSLTNATDTVDVKYYEGGTLLATDSGVTVTSGSATSTVPSTVYGQTAGDTISVSVFNQDGTPSSNSISKTVAGLPTGGTITSSGGYRYHTFTSSGVFTIPSGFSASANYLIVAGGGAGGYNQGAGGGGAGGLITGTTTLSASSNTITIGAGGTASTAANTLAPSGSNTSALSQTAIGGGGGGYMRTISPYGMNGASGGSGGGAAAWVNNASFTGGSGTSGQGYAGGNAQHMGDSGHNGGGGGGATAAGAKGQYEVGGNGGAGYQWSDGNYYAGGGGGGAYYSTAGNGGIGGGGAGHSYTSTSGAAGAPQTGSNLNGYPNRGAGGGGAGQYNGNGSSGIVIIRYQLT